jgi:hypothetical protein
MPSQKCCLLPTFPFVSFSEPGWWYSCDRESERLLLIPMVLLQANPSLSQSNANRHADIKRPTELMLAIACTCPLHHPQMPSIIYRLVFGWHVPWLAPKWLFFRRPCLCGLIMRRCGLCGSMMRRRHHLQVHNVAQEERLEESVSGNARTHWKASAL